MTPTAECSRRDSVSQDPGCSRLGRQAIMGCSSWQADRCREQGIRMKSSKLFWKVFLACVMLMVFSARLFGAAGEPRTGLERCDRSFIDRLRMSAVLLGRLVEDPLLEGRTSDLQPIVRELRKRLATVGSQDDSPAASESMLPRSQRQQELRLTVVDSEGRSWPIRKNSRWPKSPPWTTIWSARRSSRH